MWISINIALPKEIGFYKCLVQQDELGSLNIEEDQEFNGYDWVWENSFAQFISYWWCDDYLNFEKKIIKQLNKKI
jgi:hypothetical protein